MGLTNALKKYDFFWMYKPENAIDWKELSTGWKVIYSILEYFVRIVASITLALVMFIVAIIPMKTTTKRFYQTLKWIVEMYLGKFT